MKKHIVSIFAAMALLCTGCMDFEPEANMGDGQVWNSQENFQLFANQFDTEWGISINFNGTGLHISKKDIDPIELEEDELIQVCKSWTWRG